MEKLKGELSTILCRLFPEKRKEIFILLALLPILWFLSLWGSAGQKVESILRPGFQEDKESLVLSYEYRGKYGFSDTIRVDLKQGEEEASIIKEKLQQTAQDFARIFLSQKLVQDISQGPVLPRRWRQVDISYSFWPENLLLEGGDWNYFDLFGQEEARPVKIRVSMEYESVRVDFEKAWLLQADAFTESYVQGLIKKKIARQIGLLENDKGRALVLPSRLAGGDLYWKSFESRVSPKQMLGFMLVFTLMMSLLSKASAREKKRQGRQRSLRDFTQMLHHLVLLLKCGQSPYSALITICQNTGQFASDFKTGLEDCYQKIHHQEKMELAIAAIYDQCPLAEIKRFKQLFLMAYERGDEWSVVYLEEFRDELFAKRLRQANEHMQKAASRLVFPMVLFLIIIVIITIFPTFEQGM